MFYLNNNGNFPLKKLIKINTAAALLSCQVVISGCKKEEKKSIPDVVAANSSIKTTQAEDPIDYKNFNLFDIYSIDNNSFTDSFISVSDIYDDPHPVPEDLIKKQKQIPFEKLKYLELDTQHRKKMLDAIHLTENDFLFIYHYETNQLEKLPINTLKAVAYLSPYVSEGDEIEGYSYMLGFKVHSQKSSDESYGLYNNTVAAFGNKNPFAENKMKPIKWKKADPEVSKKYFQGGKPEYGKTYQAQYDDLTYYLQDFLENGQISERKLVVLNAKKEQVFEKSFVKEGEGEEFYPLNGVEMDVADYNSQWTGYLLKGKPIVIFGFLSQSFGCTVITFLDKKEPAMEIKCDNRH
ncbi:hypothetical protein [Chryseobacterium indologenes]|uniref:Uncharacterized protein n=1 Tax=Chryseobacterium indologenes TaxID=253 RepID=A0A0N0ZW19_CHRID|nr:hypothetical protein [Chryseobacterium indologenes]KPE52416.1 hypothetical protein AOB46_05985 [Chryseobacterium indologenes]